MRHQTQIDHFITALASLSMTNRLSVIYYLTLLKFFFTRNTSAKRNKAYKHTSLTEPDHCHISGSPNFACKQFSVPLSFFFLVKL